MLPTKRYCVILREDLGASAPKPTEGSRSGSEACKTIATHSFGVRSVSGPYRCRLGFDPTSEILRSR